MMTKRAQDARAEHPTAACVPPAFLREFAQAPDPFAPDDPRVEHVLTCAYCLPRLVDLRSEHAVRKTVRFRTAIMAVACAVSLAAGIALARLWYASPAHVQNSTAAAVTLNLTDYGTSRGAGNDGSSNQGPLVLPASRLYLTLILPRFSDHGTYSVSITAERHEGHSFACARGTARSQGSQTVLRIPLDLSTIRPGSYFLSTELDGAGGAYYYPVRIK